MKDYYQLVNQLTSKQIKYAKPKRRYWLLTQAVKAVLYLPLLGCLTRRSFVLVSFYLELQRSYHALEQMLPMLELVLTSKYYLDPKRRNYWWYLMRSAISLLQEQQMTELVVNPAFENKLILWGFDHYNPRFGKNDLVAYCFIAYSLWLFERAKVIEAIEFAKIAACSNPLWGYPEYLVGWYSLFLDGKESLEYFKLAIDKNWSFLHRINQDKMCQRHKSLIKQLNNNLLVKKYLE